MSAAQWSEESVFKQMHKSDYPIGHQRPPSRSGLYSSRSFDGDVYTKSPAYNILRGRSAESGEKSNSSQMACPRPPAHPPSRRGRPQSAKGRTRAASRGSDDATLHHYQEDLHQGFPDGYTRPDSATVLSRVSASSRACVRPVSQGSGGQASRRNSQELGEQRASIPPSLHARGSFSKFKLLPAIGSGTDVATIDMEMSVTSSAPASNHNDLHEDNCLMEMVAQVSISKQQPNYLVPDEPSESHPDRIKLAIKLLDGQRHERWFKSSDTLGGVLAFANSLSSKSLPLCQFCTNDVPRRVFNDFSMTLEEAGVKSFTMLYLDDTR